MLSSLTNSLIDGLHRWGAVPWLIASATVLVGAAFLLRRFGGAPLVLLVIGAAAFVLEHAIDVFLTFLLEYIVGPHPGTVFARAVWPACLPDQAFDTAKRISQLVGGICFPIGFFWYALRATRASNQTMQRTADRPSA